MQIKSPIDGSIEKIDVEVGESVNTTTQAIQVVQTDPLWIDAPVPLAQAIGLKVGEAAQVTFGLSDKQTKIEQTCGELGHARADHLRGRRCRCRQRHITRAD